MKVYISGAITNDPDYMEHFAAAELELLKMGHIAVNPAKMSSIIMHQFLEDAKIEYDHDDWLITVMVLLKHCDAIYLISGWDRSQGALQEYQTAKKLGLQIMFQGGWF